MDFYNPYLSKKPTDTKTPKLHTTRQSICRLVPKCFRNPTEKGVVSVSSFALPTYFFKGNENKVYLENGKSMWHLRRPCKNALLEEQSITFHIYDIVETTYSEDRCNDIPFKFQTDIIPNGTVLKLLGRTLEGASVCVNVFGQRNYFYVKVPEGGNITYLIKQALNEKFSPSCAYQTEAVKKKILSRYDPEEHDVFKVTVSSSLSVYKISDSLVSNGCEVFETNVDAIRRFVIDNDFSTFGWYTCKSACPRITNRDSHTDIEFDCGYYDLEFHADRTEWPPYNIMSFDIECIGEKGFPCAKNEGDLIIQISCVFWHAGALDTTRNMLLSLGTCSAVENTEVYEFPSEIDMLHGFFSLIRDFNVEIITGYNISNFDLPYLIDRATQIYNIKLSDYSRVKTGSIFQVHTPKDTGNGFMRSVSKIKISGIIAIDMYIVCKDKLSLSNYKLDTVANHCIGAKKEDVSYKDIMPLFMSGPEGRAKIGLYCVIDSVLVMKLLKFFMIHVEISEIAKLAKIPTRRVLTDGQQIRVFSCLLAAARAENYILPVSNDVNADGFQGATVINPIPGFYNNAVLVVDFASLYPSIIQAHNLCYSTLIPHHALHNYPHLKSSDYETFMLSSGPIHFVKKHIQASLLSRLLTVWLSKRKAIRQKLAECEDLDTKTILDKQQLAIKVTCNAVYGFTGVASGLLPCISIAETVTLQGRTMLEKSKIFIEAMTPDTLQEIVPHIVKHEPDAKFRVIYGDTDSLFVECVGYSVDTVVKFGDFLAAFTSEKLFNAPIKLESEKTFQCLLLLAKKRYIGILSNDKLLMKGVDLVRKTACKFVQNTSSKILNLILKDPEVKAAAQLLSTKDPDYAFREGLPDGFLKVIDILNESHKNLRTGQVPVEELTFSTELSRPISSYKTENLPHLTVYKKIITRHEEPPQVHDRIPYVFVGKTTSCISNMAEDPTYTVQNNIPIAVDLYFDKLIHGVANIIQCLFKDSSKTVSVLYNFVSTPVLFSYELLTDHSVKA
ncbi:DNA polymerase [Saimiriine gammaherpesvirus 2]|uniref:DNA polymerase catalytic subunit n=1 Tax=Saimiriine herpesvirus 2 (strain 11) TaxID=10383 RepID=DPOL_SHV21|nr:DNA polymerase [Saimiriine gammaherpesvirus 2]P24907.1 RecName: Full=DNA polymerase catalytic subunit [Herpesvirus saimiri (strain 11)]pir/DJBEM2/ DNA-directed DNA polymerase (EC 2.7.7.7) - saimiriine herpesvirus 1 (strain 11) [Saimiriine alphaherpesvirus 1]AAA46165.1 DNA polymerase [Saimiriine gammaherpesvirus 2]CAA45632.1 DNA polymerase [Saimiriine gammaherpesvirus 2]